MAAVHASLELSPDSKLLTLLSVACNAESYSAEDSACIDPKVDT